MIDRKKQSILNKVRQAFYPVAFALCVFVGGGQPVVAADVPQDFSKIVAPLLPSVVNISTTTEVKRDRQSFGVPQFPNGTNLEELFRQFFEGQEMDAPRKATSLGSGFIIDQDGKEAFIITCNHVIEEADEIKVILHDNTELKAVVVGRDKRTDIALLKVKTDKKLTPVAWADIQDVKVGQWVIAIGNPFGLSSTVTVGIVSTLARQIASRARGLTGDYIEGYIQTDASINMGNSGGPQFNADGKVIAISTAIFSPNGGNIGIGFGIPSDIAKQVYDQLRKFGRTKRGWLGVRIQGMNKAIAESLGLAKTDGALVAEVSPKGPAAKAGIKSSDVILKYNGVEVKESRTLPRIVGEGPIGKKVPLVVWRNGREVTLEALVGEFEEAESSGLINEGQPEEERTVLKKDKKILGMVLKTLTPVLADKYRVPDDVKGVLVESVDPRSNAVDLFARGDVITEVRHKSESMTVTTPAQIEEFALKIKKKIASSPAPENDSGEIVENTILFLVNRQGNSRFVPLNIDQKPEKDEEAADAGTPDHPKPKKRQE